MTLWLLPRMRTWSLIYASPLQMQTLEKPRFMKPSWDCQFLRLRHTSYCGRSQSLCKVHSAEQLGEKPAPKHGESPRRDQKARRHSALSQGGRRLTSICATNFLALYRHGHCVATA